MALNTDSRSIFLRAWPKALLLLPLAGLFIFCRQGDAAKEPGPPTNASFKEENALPAALFDSLLCSGFDYPFGNGNGGGNYTGIQDHKLYKGWYIATSTGEEYSLGIHTGEDWNGNGGGETDLGQPVYATATGKVLEAKDFGAPWGNVIYIEHRYIENAGVKTVYSLYAHLETLLVKKGSVVKKRVQIGTIGNGHKSVQAHLHFELRGESMKEHEVTYWPSSHDKSKAWVLEHYFAPSAFINKHRKLKLPASYDTLLVACKSNYHMRLYAKGKEIKRYDIALSQNPLGHKLKEGDNRLPEGHYRITEKNRGPFYGEYKAYFGPAWFRISYPNSFDAEAAFAKGAITKKSYAAILKSNAQNSQPPSNTGLGGGIGIHGWAGTWPENNRHLTWGCISMRNADLDKFYSIIPVGTPIYILP